MRRAELNTASIIDGLRASSPKHRAIGLGLALALALGVVLMFSAPVALQGVDQAASLSAVGESPKEYARLLDGIAAGGVAGSLLTLIAIFATLARAFRDAALTAFVAWLATASLSFSVHLFPGLHPLGAALPEATLLRLELTTLSLHAIATAWLVLSLFREQLHRLRAPQAARIATSVGAALALAAWVGPLDLVLIAVWSGLCAGSALVFVALSGILRAAAAAPAAWFGAGWVVQSLLWLSETLRSVGGPGHGEFVSLTWATVLVIALYTGAIVAHRRTIAVRLDRERLRALESARKYRHVYYSVPVALVSLDENGQVLRWNDAAGALFSGQLRRGRINEIGQLLGEEPARRLIGDALALGAHGSEFNLRDSDSAAQGTFQIEALASGRSIEVSIVDVSERSRVAETLEHMAHHDFLTDLLNRRGLERAIDAIPELIRKGSRVSVVYLDLDRFKAVNDLFGHAAGDAVVVEVARRLRATLPEAALVGRIGGDEFVVVLPGFDLKSAHALAGELLVSITERSYASDGLLIELAASLGVIEASMSMGPGELIAYADEACAQSKRGGRGRITALQASNELLANFRAEIRYGSQLKSSLPTEKLHIYAQPLVPLKGDSTELSYEVLLRIDSERGIPEAPARLIAAAERHGGMTAIDGFVLQRTVEHLSEHRAHANSLGFATVNLSGVSLNDERFRRDSNAMLREHPLAASKLCLEITESVALFDVRNTRKFIDQMQELGVRIALDDFGSGYTSFAYLRDLPASLLKIDGQFIRNLADEPKHQGIIRAIQQLGRELGMTCLAEWVEDVRTLRTLLDLEIDFAQGFVFSKAQPIETWLVERVDLTPLGQARNLATGRPASQLEPPPVARGPGVRRSSRKTSVRESRTAGTVT